MTSVNSDNQVQEEGRKLAGADINYKIVLRVAL
jgi:hypothetical protein